MHMLRSSSFEGTAALVKLANGVPIAEEKINKNRRRAKNSPRDVGYANYLLEVLESRLLLNLKQYYTSFRNAKLIAHPWLSLLLLKRPHRVVSDKWTNC